MFLALLQIEDRLKVIRKVGNLAAEANEDIAVNKRQHVRFISGLGVLTDVSCFGLKVAAKSPTMFGETVSQDFVGCLA